MLERRIHLFAGPTLYGVGASSLALPPDVVVRSPIVRGDIESLATSEPPGNIGVVDGLFHDYLAVGHAELREALQAGWRVWGLSSMGAIRAYEMRFLGMRGYGQVYARFEAEEDFQDDEVALLHAPEPPYRAITEPLVHMREALAALQTADLISCNAVAEITDLLKERWYGERTLRLFTDLVIERTAPPLHGAVRAHLADFDRYRVKTHDLARFLEQAPWRDER